MCTTIILCIGFIIVYVAIFLQVGNFSNKNGDYAADCALKELLRAEGDMVTDGRRKYQTTDTNFIKWVPYRNLSLPCVGLPLNYPSTKIILMKFKKKTFNLICKHLKSFIMLSCAVLFFYFIYIFRIFMLQRRWNSGEPCSICNKQN